MLKTSEVQSIANIIKDIGFLLILGDKCTILQSEHLNLEICANL